MSTVEDRMSRLEQTLLELAQTNREMQAQHQAWQDADRVRREEDRLRREEEQRRREEEQRRREEEQRRREEEQLRREEEQLRRDEAQQRRDEEQLRRDEADRIQREADKAAYEREARNAQRKWGEMANKMGTLVEDVVAPGIPTIFRQLFGVEELTATAQRVRRKHRSYRGWHREFDYVVESSDLILITQTKSTLRSADIPVFLGALREARDYLPEADGKTIVGALAAFSIDPTLVTAAERQGLLVFGLGTGLLRVLNSPGFTPVRF